MARPKMRITICYQVDYTADSILYDTENPEEMASIDQMRAEHAPFAVLTAFTDRLKGGRFKVQVKHIESEEDKTGLKVVSR